MNQGGEAADRRGLLAYALALGVLTGGVAALAASVAAPSSSVWRPILQEAGGGMVLFVALQFFIARRLGRRVIGALLVIAVAALVGAGLAGPGATRDLLAIGGVGTVLFLALDLLLVRYLVVRAMHAEETARDVLALLRDIVRRNGPDYGEVLAALAEDQRKREFQELLDEYDGANPFNIFAGLGAAEDPDWEQEWATLRGERPEK